jgi:hypothetical protein
MTTHIHPHTLQVPFGSGLGSVGDISSVLNKTGTCSSLNWPDHAVDPDGKLYKNLRVHQLNLTRKHVEEIEEGIAGFRGKSPIESC